MAWWLESVTFRHFGWVRNPQETFFFKIFGAKEQKEKTGKNQNLGEIIGKSRKNRNFGGDIYRSPPKTDISVEILKILFPGYSINDVTQLHLNKIE